MTSPTAAQAPTDKRLVVQWWPLARHQPLQAQPAYLSAPGDRGRSGLDSQLRLEGAPGRLRRKGRIIAGHTRYEAALSLGLAEVPVIVADDLTKAQQRAYRIADNKLSRGHQLGRGPAGPKSWRLVGMEIDPALTGFSAEELAALLGAAAQRGPLRSRRGGRAAAPSRSPHWAISDQLGSSRLALWRCDRCPTAWRH